MTKEQTKWLYEFLNSQKRVVAYYTYPTGFADAHILASTNDRHGPPDPLIKTTVDLLLALGQALADKRNDNKIAVKIEVHGFDYPVFAHRYDSQWVFSKGVVPRGGSDEYPIFSQMIE